MRSLGISIARHANTGTDQARYAQRLAAKRCSSFRKRCRYTPTTKKTVLCKSRQGSGKNEFIRSIIASSPTWRCPAQRISVDGTASNNGLHGEASLLTSQPDAKLGTGERRFRSRRNATTTAKPPSTTARYSRDQRWAGPYSLR